MAVPPFCLGHCLILCDTGSPPFQLRETVWVVRTNPRLGLVLPEMTFGKHLACFSEGRAGRA